MRRSLGACAALACSAGWVQCSSGFVGSASDGRLELKQHGRLARTYCRADDGNVVLTGQVDPAGCAANSSWFWVLAHPPQRQPTALAPTLLDNVDELLNDYAWQWQEWQRTVTEIEQPGPGCRDLSRASLAVLRTSEDPSAPGAAVASLSVPWGKARTDAKTGLAGYHLVWSRDLVEIAGGLLAAGARDDAFQSLCYLRATQENDGHWPQNQWVDGVREWRSDPVG